MERTETDDARRPAVAVVVLLFESGDVVERCLDALGATTYRRMDVIVADNGSRDDGAARARAHPVGARVLELPRNLGWSGGNNPGLAAALRDGADLVVLLNPDVVVPPGWLEPAVAAMAAEPTLAMLDYEGLDHPVDQLPGSTARPGEGSGAVIEADGVIGAALMVRAEAIRRIGPLDEDYFLYFEDVDWAWRALEAGYRVGRLDYVLWHESEGSSGGPDGRGKLRRAWLSMRNSIRVRLKLRPASAPGWVLTLAIHARSRRTFVHRHLLRLRPYGALRNLAMVGAAVAWNVLFLPRTLWAAARERRYRTVPWTP